MDREKLQEMVYKIEWEGGLDEVLNNYGGPQFFKDTPVHELAAEAAAAFSEFEHAWNQLLEEHDIEF